MAKKAEREQDLVAFSKHIVYTKTNRKILGLWLQVDASRRQNDPRNPAKCRRAWCALEVRPTRGKL